MKVILVVLALIWVLALTPTLLRKLAERESTYSVAKFHRSLRVMRQTYPSQAAAVTGAPVPVPPTASPAEPVGRLRGPVSSTPARAAGRPGAGRSSAQSARRRRQVLVTLGGSLVFSFLLGLVPGLSILWDVSLLLLAVTAVYVGLLIHFRRAELERAQKVVQLRATAPATGAPAGVAAADQVTAEVPTVPSFGVPAHRVTRVRSSGPVRILTDRREARTPAVIGG